MNASAGALTKRVRSVLRPYYRRWLLRRALRQFSRLPLAQVPARALLHDLIRGWDNPTHTATSEFIGALLRHAASTHTILECGSGLTTVLLGVAAQRGNARVYTLEHDSVWADRVTAELKRLALTSVTLAVAELHDYEGFHWYQPSPVLMRESFGLVVCDGPPGDTPGGRYGLLPVMRPSLQSGCVILLDDTQRDAERSIAQRWAEELGAAVEFSTGARSFATIVVP